jgi:hypothetical protein
MNELTNIDTSFSETIRNSDLKGVSVDFAENLMDALLKDGLAKDIPIIGTIVGFGQLATNLKDKIFLRKIIHFLSGISHISTQKRQKMIDEVNESKNQKIKVGEKLIYILDKCDDHISAKYVAQLFCAFLDNKISYKDFLKGSRIIQNIFLADLEYFIETDSKNFEYSARAEEIPNEDELPFINAGICGFGYSDTFLENVGFGEKEIRGGDGVVWMTDIGKKLKDILKKEE